MKHAIIVTGGKQYRVAEGDVIFVEKLDVEAGEAVKFDRVLPPHVAALLTGIAAERSAISKYVLCRRFEPLV